MYKKIISVFVLLIFVLFASNLFCMNSEFTRKRDQLENRYEQDEDLRKRYEQEEGVFYSIFDAIDILNPEEIIARAPALGNDQPEESHEGLRQAWEQQDDNLCDELFQDEDDNLPGPDDFFMQKVPNNIIANDFQVSQDNKPIENSFVKNKGPFTCKYCGRAFSENSNLKKHERIHTGEKPYVCGVCGKAFCWASSLKNHERIHTGEKPYVFCGVCGKAFSQNSNLKRHERLHAGEKPYKCKFCSKPYSDSSNCRKHEKICKK